MEQDSILFYGDSTHLKHTQINSTVYFELNVGPIRVDIHGVNGKMQRAVMSQLKPQFLATVDASVVMPAFGLRAEDAITDAPIQVVSTGTSQLMICVCELEMLRRVKLDSATLSVLMERYGFFCAHVFVRQGAISAGNTFARDFASTDAFRWRNHESYRYRERSCRCQRIGAPAVQRCRSQLQHEQCPCRWG